MEAQRAAGLERGPAAERWSKPGMEDIQESPRCERGGEAREGEAVVQPVVGKYTSSGETGTPAKYIGEESFDALLLEANP